MRKRSVLATLAAALLACSLGTTNAMAGTVSVRQDEGTFSFTMTVTAGVIDITYSDVELTKINHLGIVGGPVATDLHTGSTEDVAVTSTVSAPPLTSYTLSDQTPGIKTFGTGPGIVTAAQLQYQLFAGYAVNPGFLNLTGSVIKVISPILQTTGSPTTKYDFSPFNDGGIMSLTYNQAGVDFASIIAHGGKVNGTGGFSELAVPEPTSFALLGIGMTAFLAFRRFSKRTAHA